MLKRLSFLLPVVCAAGFSVAAVQHPDLIVTKVDWTPHTFKAGDTLTLTATIKNIGAVATKPDSAIGVGFYTSTTGETTVAWVDTLHIALAPGATQTITPTTGLGKSARWVAKMGTAHITAIVDFHKRITEQCEVNNLRTELTNMVIPVDSTDMRPDLTIASYTLTPQKPISGKPVNFSIVVKNMGKKAVSAGTVIGLGIYVDEQMDRAVCWSDTVKSGLEPGKEITLVPNNGPKGFSYWEATPTATQIELKLNDQGKILERDMTNNSVFVHLLDL